ncbi:MAG: response regulator [Planctomycetota bacterium]
MSDEKILLVDDEQDFVEMTSSLLESNGFDVVPAYSGKEAREKAAEVMPDLIILDVMMETDMAGFEAARWIREQEELQNTPIILLTAVNEKSPFKFGPDQDWLPVDTFLEKPVGPERLLGEVQQRIGPDGEE